ncbi:MAG: hypothetical protein ACKVUT_00175 [Gaiella sp.]
MFVSIDRWTLAEEVWSFGEDDLVTRALQIGDGDLLRLWRLAGENHLNGGGRSPGEAAALALVTIVDGTPRRLARRRRRSNAGRPVFDVTPDERRADVQRIEREHSFPHSWD